MTSYVMPLLVKSSAVVDDLIGAEGSHQLEIRCGAYSCDMGAEGLGQLDAGRADGSRRPMDEDRLSGSHSPRPQAIQGQDGPVAHCRRLVEAGAVGHGCERAALLHTDELRVRSEFPRLHAEDGVPDRELGDSRPRVLDNAGELASEDPLPRAADSGQESGEEWLSSPQGAVRSIDRGCVNPDQHLIALRNRLLDVLEMQHLGWPVPVVDHGSHETGACPFPESTCLIGMRTASIAGVMPDHATWTLITPTFTASG